MMFVSTDQPSVSRPGSFRDELPDPRNASLPSESGVPESSFKQAATRALAELQQSLTNLLASGPAEVRKASDVERVFGVNYLLGWQIYRLSTTQNPLANGMHVPGKGAMKKLLAAAAERDVPAAVIDHVTEAFEAVEQLVETDAGGREEWEALLSAFIPEERPKQELASKQAVFRGASQIKGVAMEAAVAAMAFNVSADGQRIDRAGINGEFGLRRFKPSGRILIGIGDMMSSQIPTLTLDGRPCDEPLGTLLPEFSTSPLPPFQTQRINNMLYYFVNAQDVGMRSAIDLVTADRQMDLWPRYRTWQGLPRQRGPVYVVATPMKQLTCDVFFHKDLCPEMPTLHIFEAGTRGWSSTIDDPLREHDRLDMQESIRALPPGLGGARLHHVPRYTEMLEHLFNTMQWDLSQFRGYRLDVQYPMYNAQYTIAFPIPDPPAGT